MECVKHKYRLQVKMECGRIVQGFKSDGEAMPLRDIYTELHITEGWIQSECQDRTGSNNINCKEIFRYLSEDEHIRTVMSIGNAGTGKTLCVQKVILDWAEEANQDVDFMFVLPFRAINLLKYNTFNLRDLLSFFYPELKKIMESIMSGNVKIILTFDGLDESTLPLNFMENMVIDDPLKTVAVDVLITSLIKGKLLPNARVWITSRPEAVCQIPSEHIDKFTEVRGFSDAQIEKYFMSHIKDQTQAKRVFNNVTMSESLYALCKIPLFCWILATVLCHYSTNDLPQSVTEFYVHFLNIATCREKKEGTGVQNNREFILKLSELAYKELVKGNVLFYENSLKEYDIPVNDPMVYCWMRKSKLKTPAFCFLHISIQEFLAALFAFYSSLNGNMECLTIFASQRGDETTMMGPASNRRKKNGSVAMATFFKKVVNVSLQKKNGHLDLFLRFLLGISLESNQKLLQDILGCIESNSDSIKETAHHIRGILLSETISPERCLNLLMCLLEMNDTSICQHIQDYVDSEKHLLPIHCSALAHMLLLSKKTLDEFDLSKYLTGYTGFKRLLVVLKVCKKARLRSCDLKEDCCEVISSALESKNSQLVILDLSNNPLEDDGLKKLSFGLKHTNCRLKTLRLAECKLRSSSCQTLASVLQSDTSHLKELDLTNNNLTNTGAVELCAALRLQSCKLVVLRLSACSIKQKGCESIASALKSNHHSQLAELDLSYNYPGEKGRQMLSELSGTQLNIIVEPETWIKKRRIKTSHATSWLEENSSCLNFTEPAHQRNRKVRQQKQREDDLKINSQTPKCTAGATVAEDSPGTSGLDAAQNTKPAWISESKIWHSELQKLMESSNNLKRVGSLIFHKEIRVGPCSNGTNIFLGLTTHGTEVAVKRVDKATFHRVRGDGIPQDLKLDSPYLVRYLEFAMDEDFLYIALQLCEYSLDIYLQKKKTDSQFHSDSLKKLAQEVLKGLQVLHTNGVIHRDIKPQNVLIDVNGQARLADFGLSRRLDGNQTTLYTDRAGTKCWEATEILNCENTDENGKAKYKKSTDIQVVGMLLYYILTMGKHPFESKPGDAHCQGHIQDGRFFVNDLTNEDAKNLIMWMLQSNPKQRPTVEHCLQHVYFGGEKRALLQPDVAGISLIKSPTIQPEVFTSVPQAAGGSASMKDNKRGQDFFMKHKGTLENRLPDFLNPILIKLHEKTVINGLEREQIQNMPIEQRNYRLITIVEKRGVKAQQLFYEVLKDVEPFLMEDLES